MSSRPHPISSRPARPRVGAAPRRPRRGDLERAQALIDDLRALVELGLVEIEQGPGGPARYRPVDDATIGLEEVPDRDWVPAA